MKTFSFKTKENSRVDVKASSPKAALKKLLDIDFFVDKVTSEFLEYDKVGIANIYSWKTTKETRGLINERSH